MNIHVFHGTAGWAVALLALVGAYELLVLLEGWLSDRLTFSGRPFRLKRRLSRPGTWVQFPDGRYGVIKYVIRDSEVDRDMAAVEPCEDLQFLKAEWVFADELRLLEYEEAIA